ncbi:hypothetical protein [Consotaella aegiceratis]|uniref:hypothetical protein n=1 Tax=Consotaella aegiceratis TaxID=3097961 RepID=UPI002F40F375
MAGKMVSFSTSDLTISEDGRVMINNPEIAKALIQHAKSVSPQEAGIFDNCSCGKTEAMRAVELSRVLPKADISLSIGSPGIRLAGPETGIFDNCSCK